MKAFSSSFLLLALLAAPALVPAQSEKAQHAQSEKAQHAQSEKARDAQSKAAWDSQNNQKREAQSEKAWDAQTKKAQYGQSERAMDGQSERARDNVIKQVRHELVMLPYYSVFDNLAYRVDGSKVTLLGDVSRPTLKADAERVVTRIEGVESVDNQIEVLPTSPNDDRIRIAVYRAIYSQTGLDRYAIMAVPSIHIIVKNGNVRLEGVVASEGDKNLANVTANGVSGVFSVTNNLTVEQ